MREKASKAQLKKIRELMREKQVRDAEGLFVIEGRKIVADAIAKNHDIEYVAISRGFADDSENNTLISGLREGSVPLFEAAGRDIEKISTLQNSQGILAIARKRPLPESVPCGGETSVAVLCDGIQDPGNLGTMVRTIAAFGVDFMVLTPDTADVYNPKVVRASSGTILDIPIYRYDMEELDALKEKGFRLLAASSGGQDSMDINKAKEYSGSLILAFGSEGKGISKEVADRADGFFHIPISADVESLNVAAAAAISVYVFSRRVR